MVNSFLCDLQGIAHLSRRNSLEVYWGITSLCMATSSCRFSVEIKSVHFILQICHGAIKDWKHEMALSFWSAGLILLCADPHFSWKQSWSRKMRKGNNRNSLRFIKQWSCWSSTCFRWLNPFLSVPEKKQDLWARKYKRREKKSGRWIMSQVSRVW